MQDGAANGGLLGVSFQLGHQVVVDFGFDLQGARHVYCIDVPAQIGQLLVIDQPVPGLDFGQNQPKPAPQPALVGFAPDLPHLRAAIPPGEGGEIGFRNRGSQSYYKTRPAGSQATSAALRLAKYFGMSADFWMNVQLRWDLYFAQQKETRILKEIQPYISHAD